MKEYLKVRVASLSEEARIIKRLEQRARKRKESIREYASGMSHTPESKRYSEELAAVSRLPATVENINEARRLTTLISQTMVQSQSSFDYKADAEYKHALALQIGLREHRVQVVREAARCSHLALGMVRGVPYSAMEQFAYLDPNFKEVERLVLKYSEDDPRVLSQKLEEWIQTAREYIKSYTTQRQS